MAFTPRLTAPSTSDPNWISTGYGGYNQCIVINSVTGSVLPNCFTGDTEILTHNGCMRLDKLVGQKVEVACIDNCWHLADIHYFGVQPIWEVYLSSGLKYRCSENHIWYVKHSDEHSYYPVPTYQLHIGLQVPYFQSTQRDFILCVRPTYDILPVYCAVEPVTHTMTLADGVVTGQCVGYAWGRFREILGTTPKLSKGDGGSWYGYTADGYKRGSTPQLGAVACYGQTGSWGHVAIVEQIHSDGSITCSQSGYNSQRFWTEQWYPPKYIDWGGGYYFQGFIYCPAVAGMEDKLSQFLKEAESHIGENGDWTWSYSGLGRGQAWCAAFIMACAKKVGGLIGQIFPMTYGAGTVPREGVPKKMGTWHPGPAQGQSFVPQPGDTIHFRWNSPASYIGCDTYFSDHIGIVKSVSNGVVSTIEGNSGGTNWTSRVRSKTYSLSSSVISGYYRPDWAKVGASVNNLITGIGGNLYDMVNTREDAIIREIAYMNGTKPSISTSSVKLSVVNYTSLLGQFFQGAISNGISTGGVSIDASGVNNSVCRAIIQYLTGKGFNAATACGIAGNIQQECSFNIGASTVDSNGLWAGGICMWNGPNFTSMKKYVGSNWQNDLTGQLNYLWYDMTVGQPSWFKLLVRRNYGVNETIVNMLMACPNTEAGVRRAADIFVRCYENSGSQDQQSIIRGNNGVTIYRQVINQLT